jgi:hypothetical protein
MPIEVYNFVRKVKRYYTFLQQIYKIIYDKFRDTSIEMSL